LVGAVVDGSVGTVVVGAGVSCPGNGAEVGTGFGTIVGFGRTPLLPELLSSSLPSLSEPFPAERILTFRPTCRLCVESDI
jgi:hypothetical protein